VRLRLRWYALGLLVLVGVVPLVTFGLLATSRAERTAEAEVRAGTERVAETVARRIAAHIEAERELLHTVGSAILLSGKPAYTHNAYEIQFPHLHGLTVYGVDGTLVVGQGSAEADEDHRMVAATASAGKSASAPVKKPSATSGGPFAHTVTLGEPISIAGERAGAVVAQLDLVGIWTPVNSARVGTKGFVRLVARDGTLLAHGDPEERRDVFRTTAEENRQIVERARAGQLIENSQGEQAFAAVAEVGARDWVVVVEQPVEVALGSVRAMRRDLFFLAGGGLLLAAIAALFAGRKAVKAIEKVESHTRVLASGDLDAVIDARSGIAEIDNLGARINDMATSLKRLNQEAQVKERMNTFGRVAAGLAHDIRLPIENVREACETLAVNKDDPAFWDHFEFIRVTEIPKLRQFIEDLHRLSIQDAGKLSPHTIDTTHLLEDVAHQLRGSLKFSNVSFAVDSKAGELYADERLLQRAIFNLGKNAAEACAMTNRPQKEVRFEAVDQPEGVVIRVKDTGSGIAPEMLERIMTGDFHSTKRTNGIGLGFGVARHVAHIHGGKLEGTSQVGAGTTFTMLLPRAADDQPEDGQQAR
jgi:signal transduction histidine kinase